MSVGWTEKRDHGYKILYCCQGYKMLENVGASLSKQQSADLLFCHGTGFFAKLLTRDKYKYHICQPFLQPGQLTWLHMHALSFTLKS